MLIRIGFRITIDCVGPTPLLLALSPHPEEEHRCLDRSGIRSSPETPLAYYVDEFGNRRARLVAAPGPLTLSYDDVVLDTGSPDPVDWDARQLAVETLPAHALPYLKASRYCETDLLSADAWSLFGGTAPGWPRVQAICDWVHRHVTFGYQFGSPTKTAADAHREAAGVCRDYAHLAIAFCRAMNIPARYVSGYLGDIGVPPAGPGDFCAWFEAFLDGRWYTFDARYNVPRIGRVPMVRGRDAADVPMIMAFGSHRLTGFEVWADQVKAEAAATDAAGDLSRLPGFLHGREHLSSTAS